MLGGKKFALYTAVQPVVLQWHDQQPASFFASNIQKFADRHNNCLSELGQYVEQEIRVNAHGMHESL